MIYPIPRIVGNLGERLAFLADLREQLRSRSSSSSLWMGSLRREVRASSIESSTSIEGYSVDPEEAIALTSGGTRLDHDDDNAMAVACYARAMDHVGAMAADPSFRWLDRVILDLHFEACHFQLDKAPGRWRTGEISVMGARGKVDYQGPPGSDVPRLMEEVVDWLAAVGDAADAVVVAAIAHLNVTSVHPFRDGNGRVSRIVQSLVLAREGSVSPEFASIEEYLRDHTADYYAALREVQGGRYQPDRDATGWVSFCVDAHIAQARRRLEQIEEAAERWERAEQLVAERGWPDRLTIALEQSLIGGSDRGKYSAEADVSPATASGDFRRLLDAGLVQQTGKGRLVRYLASPRLREEL
jgi:Fic family protein